MCRKLLYARLRCMWQNPPKISLCMHAHYCFQAYKLENL